VIKMSNSIAQGSGFVLQSSAVGATNAEPGTRNSKPVSPLEPLFSSPVSYPFAAVAGHEKAKHALLLLAIEPDLRGALIASESGSSKSVLARSFAAVFPVNRSEFVKSSAQAGNCDTRMVELPLGVTEDRLLGGLDLERTLATGKRQVSQGLLAQADGQILYADSINLLDSNIVTYLAHALESRRVLVERESVSATHAADFVLVATFNRAEGEPSSLLRDRVGLIVQATPGATTDIRAEIVEREFRFEKDAAGFAGDFAFETSQGNQAIEAARTRLHRVRVSGERRRQIAQIAMRLGVEGNRADLFALKAARANAALAARESVGDEDVVVAMQLVLAPRATTLLGAEDAATQQQNSRHENDKDNRSENQDVDDSSLKESSKVIRDEIDDLIIAAIDTRAPKGVLAAAQEKSRRSRSGRRFKGSPSTRGRHVRSEPRRTSDARVAIDATLRAAAPFQLRRRLADSQAERPDGKKATLPAERCAHRVKIQPSDLRYKTFTHRSGITFIFAVDASGSMTLNRMAQAKGALTRLLGEAYLHRDKVALISFRGEGSQVLLAPTRSVELAKRLVDSMPTGGGTPISAGVLSAIELARLSRLQGMSQAMLVLFSDGRANVRLRQGLAIEEELKQLGALLRAEGIATVVVDTKAKFLSNEEGCALAEMLGSRYLFLPRPDAMSVYEAIASIAGRTQERQWLKH